MEDILSIIDTAQVIALIDADLIEGGTRHPNLALMKISGYLKERDKCVDFLFEADSYSKTNQYDAVFISKVFSFTLVPSDLLNRDNVYCGGTGFFSEKAPDLPGVIEHHMPDYDLYEPFVKRGIANGRKRSWFADYLDYSIGFSTRGCFRKCDFCVNKKYNKAIRHSPVSEFLDPKRRYIYLWDDNFFAYTGWEEILHELQETGKPFQFRQGLDIRLLTVKKAVAISSSKYKGDFIFAFDHIEEKEEIIEKLKLWRSVTNKGTRLYILCAYDSQDETDIISVFERIKILMKLRCLPYLMRYESYKTSPFRSLYVNMARWCNQPQIFKKMSFRQFCVACQRYHKTPDTFCSAYKSMVDFEIQFPRIAEHYFDLRYEEEKDY